MTIYYKDYSLCCRASQWPYWPMYSLDLEKGKGKTTCPRTPPTLEKYRHTETERRELKMRTIKLCKTRSSPRIFHTGQSALNQTRKLPNHFPISPLEQSTHNSLFSLKILNTNQLIDLTGKLEGYVEINVQ